jgi:hypothetical protein
MPLAQGDVVVLAAFPSGDADAHAGHMIRGRVIAGVAAGGVAAAVYGGVLRPRLMRWGANDVEVAAPYPGAEIVPHGERGATMAVTIDVPPDQVWPWLVQLGGDRAGWYSWDRLDNGGRPSAREVHSEWQARRRRLREVLDARRCRGRLAGCGSGTEPIPRAPRVERSPWPRPRSGPATTARLHGRTLGLPAYGVARPSHAARHRRVSGHATAMA